MQDCSISIANALEILQSCTKPSKWSRFYFSNCCAACSIMLWLPWWNKTQLYLLLQMSNYPAVYHDRAKFCYSVSNSFVCCLQQNLTCLAFELLSLYPLLNEVEGGHTGFTLSVCPSERPSVRLFVHLWTVSCPLCIFYNTRQIHLIFTHLIKQLQKVYRM